MPDQDQNLNPKTYQSKYTNKQVTAAQYLAELICENQATKNKVQLVPRFWSKKEWKNKFVRQTQIAIALLQIYPAEVLIKLVRRWNILTLTSKFLETKLSEEKFTYSSIVESTRPTEEKPRLPPMNPNFRGLA